MMKLVRMRGLTAAQLRITVSRSQASGIAIIGDNYVHAKVTAT